MTTPFQLRRLAIYLVILPLAVAVGYFLSQPDDPINLILISLVFAIGLLPLIMKWHHGLLIIACNATLNAAFLPGQPDVWIVMTVLSLFFSLLKRTISRQVQFLSAPLISWPLFVLGLIVLLTAFARRVVGVQPGYQNEIRRYVFVIAEILAFYALTAQGIPKKRALLYASLFFVSGVTAVMSDIIYVAGPSFYFLFYLFPSGLALLQATHDISMMTGGATVFRIEGVAWASVAFSCFLLLRYGAGGILDLRRPWRLIIFILTIVGGLFGGFRGRLFLIFAFFVVQFCFEGLWRTRWLPILLGLAIVTIGAVLPFTDKLPQSFQRAVSFLPVEVDPIVRQEAQESTVWRLEMWRTLTSDISKYFWFGKGYTFSETQVYLTQLAVLRGQAKSYDVFALTGEYHSGPLSIIIPFGIWGLIAFLWFIAAGWWALYCNYRNGDPDLKRINTFFLTYFTVRAIFFFVVYGAFHVELIYFTSVLGFSIALNGGVHRKKPYSLLTGQTNVPGKAANVAA